MSPHRAGSRSGNAWSDIVLTLFPETTFNTNSSLARAHYKAYLLSGLKRMKWLQEEENEKYTSLGTEALRFYVCVCAGVWMHYELAEDGIDGPAAWPALCSNWATDNLQLSEETPTASTQNRNTLLMWTRWIVFLFYFVSWSIPRQDAASDAAPDRGWRMIHKPFVSNLVPFTSVLISVSIFSNVPLTREGGPRGADI